MGIKTQDNTLSVASTISYPFENSNKLKRQPAIDENLMAREQQNLLNATGQTSTQSDPRQIEKAISMLVANSNLYTTSGTANTIILTTKTINSANTDAIQMSNLHFDQDGVKYEFVANFTNTGATTVAITGFLTAQNVVDINGAALIAGSIINGRRYTLIRDKINNRFIKEQSFLLPKPIILSYVNTTTLNYTSGTFDADDYSARYSVTAGTINLATNGLNGLDTGSVPADGWFYTYAIYNPTTGASGLIASLSATTPTLPSGFTKKQRIRNGFIRIVTSVIFGFDHSANGWIPTGRMQVVSQTNVTNFQQLFCPTVKITVSINAYFSLTQVGQSTMAVWGDLKPFTGGAPDTVFNAQNNASTDGNNGEIEMSDGIVRATHPVISGGVNNATITILKINELN
jgi:hypothetical protein